MKKSILFFCIVLTAIGIIAMDHAKPDGSRVVQKETSCKPNQSINNDLMSIINWHNESDFFFDIGPRFTATITRENLNMAKTVLDLVPLKANWTDQPIKMVNITVHGEISPVIATGAGIGLNSAQTQLLRSANYSNSFRITASCSSINSTTGILVNYDLVYYISVTPEKEAQYIKGRNALIIYLHVNSKPQTAFVETNKLQPGKLFFTVTKEGAIINTRLEGTSGYKSIDDRMIELMMDTTSEWVPAENAKGEKIDQELVLHFGTMGC